MKNQRTIRALSLAAIAAIPALAARGQTTSTWVPNSGTQNMNVAGNWSTNAVPASGSNTALVFGGSGTDSYLAVENIASTLTLNKLTVTSTSSNPIVIGGTANNAAANTMAFSGAGASVVHSGTGDVYLNGPISLTSATTFDVQQAGTKLYVLGDIANTASALTKVGAGTLVWGMPDPVTVNAAGGTNAVTIAARGINVNLTGPVNVNAGTLLIGNTGGSFLSNSSQVTVAAGATFDFNNNGEDFGSLAGGGTLIANGADVNLGYDNRSVTWSGQIQGTDPTAILSKRGTGTWTVTTYQPYQSKTLVAAGTMALSGTGSINNSSEVEISPGATLRLDNTAQDYGFRVGDEVTTIMNGNSELVMVGNGSANSNEMIGVILVRGLSTLTVQPGAGRSASITTGQIRQEPGGTGAADNGMVLFRGKNLGGTPGAADTSNIFIYYPVDLVGGGTGPGTTTQSILPYGLGDTSPTGLGNSLVTYDSTNGIRPLNVGTEFATYAAGGATSNVRITGSASGLAGKAVNALVVDNSTGSATTVDGTAGQALAVNSGAMLFSGSSPITLSGFGSVAFGDLPGYLSSANLAGATITSPVTGTQGVVKGGAGLLTLTAANTYTGGTIVTAGTLRIANDNNLGATSGNVAFNAGTLQISADVNSNRTFTSNTGGFGTIDTAAHTLTLSKVLAGSGEWQLTGNGTLVVPEVGTGGALTMTGGTLKVTKNATTGTNGRAVTLNTGVTNTVDTNGFSATLGAIDGDGSFTKTGNGTLLIQGGNTFNGDITIAQGTVKINGTAGSFFQDPTVSFIAAGATLDMSDNSEAWGGISGAGTIITGTATNCDVNLGGSRDTTWDGVIQGAGDFIKNGTHTITMTGQSTFTGPTTINVGAVVVKANVLPNANGPLGKATTAITMGNNAASPATLLIGQSGVEVGRAISVASGNTAVVRLGSNHTSGVSTFSGAVTMPKNVEVTAAAGGQTDFTGVLSGAGTLTKTGAGVIRLAGVNTYTGATTVSAGTLRIDGSATNTASLTVNNTGTFEAGSSQTLKSLVVNAGGTAKIAAAGAGLKVGALTATGKVDVGTGTLVVDYATTSPAAAIRTALIAGRGAAGNWSGTAGITSSGITGSGQALGYFEGSTLGATGGTYRGVTVDGTSVIVARTVLGDATMDGTVNFDDLLALAKNYNSTTGTWVQGDFDYNGTVNFDDLLGLAKNYNQALAAPTAAEVVAAGQSAAFASDVSAAFAAAVPEPSSAAVVLAGALGMGLGGRRRRRAAR